MPVIRSAIKKLRKDRKRTKINLKRKENLKKLIKIAQKSPTDKNVRAAISALDRAAKVHLLHKNKAARLKSKLSKLPASSLTKSLNSSRLKA